MNLQLHEQPGGLPVLFGLDAGHNLAAVSLMTGHLRSTNLLAGAGLHIPVGSRLGLEGIVRAGYAHQVLMSETEGGADGNVRLDLSDGRRYVLPTAISSSAIASGRLGAPSSHPDAAIKLAISQSVGSAASSSSASLPPRAGTTESAQSGRLGRTVRKRGPSRKPQHAR